ncbi:magnesium transporter [Marinobacter sp.]|uniref:magnesium transporter n=1 Tax=Marinobacter sp. TaxID=50741 RepID=UPI00384FB2F3
MDEKILSAVSELRQLEPDRRAEVLRTYPSQEASAIFEQLEAGLQEEVLEHLPEKHVRKLLMDLDPDDRVQLLDAVAATVADEFLAHLSPRERRLTQKLLAHPEESAGHIMTPEYLPLSPSLTAEQALGRVREKGSRAGTVNVLPVVDEEGFLKGLVMLGALVMAEPATIMADLMLESVPTVSPETDQEEVARLVQAADLLALPVVDAEGRLLGLVTVDDALDILHMEQEEDFARAGASAPMMRPYFSTTVRELTRARLVWLLLLGVAGTLTVQVLNTFENLLEQAIALSLFIPLLIGVGGNSGAQSATTVTRAIAVGDILRGPRAAFRVVARETRVGFLLGAALGVLAYPAVIVLFEARLALTVAITLVAICTLATLVGSGMPLLARRLGIDPALVSAPLVTTIVDASGLVGYFMVAKAVMGL